MYRDIPVDYVDGSDRTTCSLRIRGTTNEQGQLLQVKQLNQSGNVRLRFG